MRRRDFVRGSVGFAVSRPLSAHAQQERKPPTIGFMGASSLSAIDRYLAAWVQRLNELGWIDGRSVLIEYRWANGRNERMAEIATEFVRMKVDIIVTHGTAAVIAAKQATSIIPIVFAVAGDPVGTGLVASLARPGGNVTGLSIQQTDTAAKRLELLRQVVPNLQRLAIIANPETPGGRLRNAGSSDSREDTRPRDFCAWNPANRRYRTSVRNGKGQSRRRFYCY